MNADSATLNDDSKIGYVITIQWQFLMKK